MEKEFARLMMLLLDVTQGKGFQLFVNHATARKKITWADAISVSIDGKFYKSANKSMRNMTNEVVWRIRNGQPNDREVVA